MIYRLFLIAFALILGASLSGCCHWHHREWSQSPDRGVDYASDKIKRDLKLSDDQTRKLNDLTSELKAVLKESDSSSAKSEIKKLIESPTLEESQVKSAMLTMREHSQQSVDANFNRVFQKLKAFHDSLTPDQQKKAAELFEKYSDSWKHL